MTLTLSEFLLLSTTQAYTCMPVTALVLSTGKFAFANHFMLKPNSGKNICTGLFFQTENAEPQLYFACIYPFLVVNAAFAPLSSLSFSLLLHPCG